jgi:signal transduction histidine kinase
MVHRASRKAEDEHYGETLLNAKTIYRVILSNNMDSSKKNKYQYQENTRTETLFSGNPDINRSFESLLLQRLSKMREINVQLENRAGEYKNKLDEVKSTNAKFLSIVAHDLRSPLTSIITLLDMLGGKFNKFSKTELEDFIHMASSSAINTLNLLDNLLAWSILQNKQKSINPNKINLCELIIYEFESFHLSADKKQITMDHSIAPGLYVTADIQMLKTIFRNLISNAIKYSNTGGAIFISATKGKQFIEIAVSDNGIGMSQNTKDKLFKIDGFHSITGTDKEKGTGLGLMFCKEFIEAHCGRIWLESEPGKGSTFRFTLPHCI